MEDCPICDDSRELIKLSCDHKYCASCLVDSFKYKIQDNEHEIGCPGNCGNILEMDFICAILVDELDLYDRLERNIDRYREREKYYKNKKLADSEDIWFDDCEKYKPCPHCNILIERIEGCDCIKCPNCKRRFCYNCLELYRYMESVDDHAKKCENFRGFNDDENDSD